MNMTDNNIAFRLPEDHLRELNRISGERGQSRGVVAKQMVMDALHGFSRFDELSHRLANVERILKFMAEHPQNEDGSMSLVKAIHELRAMIATAAYRALVELAQIPSDQAAEWVKSTFDVKEDSA